MNDSISRRLREELTNVLKWVMAETPGVKLPSTGVTLAALAGTGAALAIGNTISGFGKVHAQVGNHRLYWERELLLALYRAQEAGLLGAASGYYSQIKLADNCFHHTDMRKWFTSNPFGAQFSVGAAGSALVEGTASPIIYVALGDSAAQGVGVQRVADGYTSRFASWLEAVTGREVLLLNLSVSGAVATSVAVYQLPLLHSLGVTPDVITLDIGGNDVFVSEEEMPVADFVAAMDLVCSQLPAGALIADIPSVKPLAQNKRGKVLHKELCKLIADYGHHRVPVRAYSDAIPLALVATVRAPDFFHPSEASYQATAQCFAREAQRKLGFGADATPVPAVKGTEVVIDDDSELTHKVLQLADSSTATVGKNDI